MLIGLTYDLRDDYKNLGLTDEQIAEFDTLETINALEATITSLGHQTFRIGNAKSLAQHLAKGARWDLVFNIAEGLYGLAREAQVPTLLDIYQIPYTFSSPTTMVTTLDKALAKTIVQKAGVPTADFAVINKISDLQELNLQFPLFAKPLAEGTGKGISDISRVKNKQELTEICQNLLNKFQQPVLLETYLSGREFTVGFLGNDENCQAIGVLEVLIKNKAESYSYNNKKNYEALVEYRLANDSEAMKAAEIAKKAWQTLDCKDAGRVDLRSDKNGNPHFLEVNPLSGIDPKHSDLVILSNKVGISYAQLISVIIDSARKRHSI